MTLLQVNPSFAATNPEGRQANVVLSQGQLAALAKQDYALYRHVLDAYRSGSRLVVTERQYEVLSHLKTAYLGNARAGQAAAATGTGAPGSPIVVPKTATPVCTAPATGPLVQVIAAACSAEGPIGSLMAVLAAFWPPLAVVPAILVIAVLILIVINDIFVLFQPQAPAPAK
jgi:hypothetical protein